MVGVEQGLALESPLLAKLEFCNWQRRWGDQVSDNPRVALAFAESTQLLMDRPYRFRHGMRRFSTGLDLFTSAVL